MTAALAARRWFRRIWKPAPEPLRYSPSPGLERTERLSDAADPRKFALVYDTGQMFVTDRDGLLARLEQLTEQEWYLAQDLREVPLVWFSTDGLEFTKLFISCQSHCDRTGLSDHWTLSDVVTRDVVDEFDTEFADPGPLFN